MEEDRIRFWEFKRHKPRPFAYTNLDLGFLPHELDEDGNPKPEDGDR